MFSASLRSSSTMSTRIDLLRSSPALCGDWRIHTISNPGLMKGCVNRPYGGARTSTLAAPAGTHSHPRGGDRIRLDGVGNAIERHVRTQSRLLTVKGKQVTQIADGPACPGLVEYSLSAPRGPVCCVPTRKACPIHISLHRPTLVSSIGIGHADGCTAVPDDSPIKNRSAADMPPLI